MDKTEQGHNKRLFSLQGLFQNQVGMDSKACDAAKFYF
jgi:hypothetical protein